MTEERAKELFKELDLVGVSDIAKMLGWTSSKLSAYRAIKPNSGYDFKSFPPELGTIGGRPVWQRDKIRNWIEKRS